MFSFLPLQASQVLYAGELKAGISSPCPPSSKNKAETARMVLLISITVALNCWD